MHLKEHFHKRNILKPLIWQENSKHKNIGCSHEALFLLITRDPVHKIHAWVVGG